MGCLNGDLTISSPTVVQQRHSDSNASLSFTPRARYGLNKHASGLLFSEIIVGEMKVKSQYECSWPKASHKEAITYLSGVV